MSLVLWLVAYRLPHTASSVYTLSSWIQHCILSVILPSQIWELQNSIFLGSRSWQKCTCNIPDGENLHADSMYPWGSFQLSSVPQRQLSASARHSGTQSWRHGSGYGIQADPQHRAPTRRRARVQEHSPLHRRLSLPGLIVMTFQRLSWRRRLQSLRPSETFQRLVRHEMSICRVLQFQVVLDATVSLWSVNWDLQRYTGRVHRWVFKNEGLKASTDDHPSTQKLLYSFLFDSRATATLPHIASKMRTAMPCAPRSHLASGDRDHDGRPRPTRPRPPRQFSSNFTIAIFWVRFSQKNACQTHSLLIHLWETKPRWKKAKKKEKKKKNAGWFLAGGSFATFELCCVRPWYSGGFFFFVTC